MLHPRRERLADLAKHFRAEQQLFPDLWHSFVRVGDRRISETMVNLAWAQPMGYSPKEFETEVRLKAIMPSAYDLTVPCHHYFCGGEGIGEYSTLARLLMTELWGSPYAAGNGRVYAPFHWMEVVHKECGLMFPDDDDGFLKTWSIEKPPLTLSMIRPDVFTACEYVTEFIAEGLFPAPIALGKWGQVILDALDGKAMTADKLSGATGLDRSDLINDYIGNKGCLRVAGLVKNQRRLGGYYRPDAPPRPPGGNGK